MNGYFFIGLLFSSFFLVGRFFNKSVLLFECLLLYFYLSRGCVEGKKKFFIFFCIYVSLLFIYL